MGGGGGSSTPSFAFATGRSGAKGSGDPGTLLVVEARDASDANLRRMIGSVSECNSLG